MEQLVKELTKVIRQENQKLKQELKEELKQELKQELRQDLRQDFKQDIKESIDSLKQEMNSRFWLLEENLGTKIDIMYDYVMIQKEIFGEKFENLRNLDKRMEICEIRNLDHEKRISILERNCS